jgi:hypothetical protein
VGDVPVRPWSRARVRAYYIARIHNPIWWAVVCRFPSWRRLWAAN